MKFIEKIDENTYVEYNLSDKPILEQLTDKNEFLWCCKFFIKFITVFMAFFGLLYLISMIFF